MPRLARVDFTVEAHHVTQRGTGRQTILYTRAGLRILAYCLMPDHIHLIAVRSVKTPSTSPSSAFQT